MHTSDSSPVFRVRTCRRKDPAASDCERGVQLVPGPASLRAGGQEERKGNVEGGCAGQSDGAKVMESAPSVSRIVPLVYDW